MTKFPAAEAVIRDLAAKDAQFAIDFEAFLDGMLEEAPNPGQYSVSRNRAREICRNAAGEWAA